MKKKNILYQLFDTPFPWIPSVGFAGFLYWFQPNIWEGLGFFVVVAAFGFWGWVRSQKQA